MKVSVAMCTYNGEKFLKEQLDSINNQTILPDEIIIYDDGSTDKTESIIKEYQKKNNLKIEFFKNKKNVGVTQNFINAFSKCSGDIIFLCDQDDVWEKNKVEEFLKIFSNKKINMIGTNANLINGQNELLSFDLWDAVEYCFSENNLFENYKILEKHAILTGATAAVRKSFVDKFMFNNPYMLHDYVLSFFAAFTDSLYMSDKKLTNYRIHSNNVVGVKKKKSKTQKFFSKFTNIKERYFKSKEIFNQYNELDKYIKTKKINLVHQDEFEKLLIFWNYKSNIGEYNFKTLIKNIKKIKDQKYYRLFSNNNQFVAVFCDIYFWINIKIRRI